MSQAGQPARSENALVAPDEGNTASVDRLCPDVSAPGRGWKRDAALAALLTASTIADAARTAGVSERSVRRWLSDPSFAAKYASARRQALDQAICALQQATGEAVATLRRNLTAGIPSVEVRAASEILAQCARWQELNALEDRVAALEEGAAIQGPAWD